MDKIFSDICAILEKSNLRRKSMPDVRIKTLPPPHGGKIIERVVRDPEMARKLMEKCSAVYDIKPTFFKGNPVRNVYREIMSVCYGFFSPVEGSMTKADLESVS